MEDNAVLAPPAASSDRLELMKFARALGTRLSTITAEVAGLQASLLQRAGNAAPTEFERGLYEGLRLAVEGHAQRLASEAVHAATIQGDGPGVYRVLAALSVARTPMRPSEIATELDLAGAYVSRLLRTMSNDGLVEQKRRAIPTDGRAVTYAVTALGEDRLIASRTAAGPDDVPTPAQLRQTRLRSARSMLAGIQERRRRGEARARDDAALGRIIKTAEADHDNELAVDAMGERATAARQRANTAPDQSPPLLASAISALAEHASNDAYARARHEYELGKRLVASDQDISGAQARFSRADALLRDWPTSSARVWNDLALAECSRLSGDVFAAIKYAKRANETAVRREDSFATARSGIQLSLAYRIVGMVEPCESLLNSVLELAREHSFTELIAESRLHLGEVVRYKGDVDTAAELLRQATEGFSGQKNHGRGLAFAISALGACYFDDKEDTGNLERSHNTLSRALEVSRSANAWDAQALTMRRLGLVTSKLGDAEQGRKLITDALAIYQRQATSSLVGQLECRTSLMAAGTSPDDLAQALTLLERVGAASAGEHGGRARIVDRWVFDSLRRSAETLDDRQSVDAVIRCRTAMADRRLAGGPQIQKGRSAMGKEPVLLRLV